MPFSLIAADAAGKALTEQTQLAKASRPFLGNLDAPGFLGSEVWRILAKTIEIDGARIFTPNPGAVSYTHLDVYKRQPYD